MSVQRKKSIVWRSTATSVLIRGGGGEYMGPWGSRHHCGNPRKPGWTSDPYTKECLEEKRVAGGADEGPAVGKGKGKESEPCGG